MSRFDKVSMRADKVVKIGLNGLPYTKNEFRTECK